MTSKQQILEVIERLPDDVPVDQVIEELYLLHKIQIGLEQVQAGRVVPPEEVKQRLLAPKAASR
jgi:predicted transcriptional regulator